MTAISVSGRIELSDPDFADSLDTYSGLHAMSPILLGLMLPSLAIALLAPRGYHGLQAMAIAMLFLVMLAAAAIYGLSVFNAGRVGAVAFDIDQRRLDIVSVGMFARRVEQVPFSSIADVRLMTRYNRAGRAFVTTEAVMRTGEIMSLPVAPSPVELQAIRLAVGAR